MPPTTISCVILFANTEDKVQLDQIDPTITGHELQKLIADIWPEPLPMSENNIAKRICIIYMGQRLDPERSLQGFSRFAFTLR